MAVNVSGGALEFDAVINLGDFERDLARMRAGLQSLTDAQSRQSAGLEDFAKRAAKAAAGFLSIQAAEGFIRSMVEVRGQFQQIEVAFTTMLKSKDQADKLMAQAVKLAAITPFTLQEVASGAKQLLAYGFAAKDVTKQLETLGNIASGVGSNLNDVVYLYGTLKASGRVTQIDINQFAGRGIPIYQALADVMKINVDQVRSYVSAGKIGFPQVEAAFNKLTGSGGQFFNLMQEQSKTLTGQLSNLGDAWDRMLNALGKENEGLFADSIGGAIKLIDNYQKVIDIIKVLIATYGAYRVAVLLNAVTLNGWTFAEGINIQALILKESVMKSLTAATASGAITVAAYTAVIAALGLAVYSVVQLQSAEEIAQKAVNKAIAEGERAVDSENDKINGLIDTIKNHTSTLEEKKQAYADLQNETAGYLRTFSLEEIAAGKAAGAIALFDGHLQHLKETESEYAQYKELGKKIDELKEKGIDAVGTFDKLGLSLKNLFKVFVAGNASDKENEAVLGGGNLFVNQQIKKLQDAQKQLLGINPDVKKKIDDDAKAKKAAEQSLDAIKKFNDLLAKGAVANYDQLLKIAPNKDSLEKLQKALTDVFDNLAPGDKAKSGLKAKIQAVTKLINDEYGTSVKAAVKQANDRKTFLENLSKLESASVSKSLDDNAEALAAITRKYNDQRNKAADLKLGPDVIKRINTSEKNETTALKYEQDTKLLKDNLEKQKSLQVEYDADVEKFGIDAAKAKYAGQLVASKSYFQQLTDEQAKILKTPVADRTGNKNERLKVLNDLLDEETKRERENTKQRLENALEQAKTYNDERLRLDLEYYKNVEAIQNDKNIKDKSGALDELKKNRDKDQSSLALANIEDLASYKEVFDGLHKLTVDQTNKDIADILKVSEARKKAGLLSEEDFLKLKKNIANVKDDLNKFSTQNLKAIGGVFSSLSQTFANVDKGLSNSLGKVGDLVSGLGDIKSGFDIVNSSTSSASDKFSASLGIAGTFVGLFNKLLIDPINSAAAERTAQIEAGAKLQVQATEAVTKALERQLQIAKELYGPERLSAYIKQLDDLKKAQVEAQNTVNTKIALDPKTLNIDPAIIKAIQQTNDGSGNNFTKALIDAGRQLGAIIDLNGQSLEQLQQLLDGGRLDENTASMVKNLIALQDQITDTNNALHSELLGIDFSTLEDNIISLFQNANSSVDDFGKNFEETMQKAILNSFKRDALEKQLQGFYDNFYDYSLSGNNLSEDEIAKLNAQYDKVIADAKKQFEDLQKATGIDLTTGSSDSTSDLSNAVKGITTDQADLLAGQFGGQRLATLAGNQIAINNGLSLAEISAKSDKQLEQLIKIEANTKRGADNTDGLVPALTDVKTLLVSMDKKAGSPNGTLSANGLS
jgi:tape measure domain-containing protein